MDVDLDRRLRDLLERTRSEVEQLRSLLVKCQFTSNVYESGMGTCLEDFEDCKRLMCEHAEALRRSLLVLTDSASDAPRKQDAIGELVGLYRRMSGDCAELTGLYNMQLGALHGARGRVEQELNRYYAVGEFQAQLDTPGGTEARPEGYDVE